MLVRQLFLPLCLVRIVVERVPADSKGQSWELFESRRRML
jgi:hypothetical protein